VLWNGFWVIKRACQILCRQYTTVRGENIAHTEKLYCPVCKEKTTFICKDKSSGYFCLKCGYRIKAGGSTDEGKEGASWSGRGNID